MTSKQIAFHTLKAVTKLDLATAPMEVKQELVDSLNLTLAGWLTKLPTERKIIPQSGTARAPVTQSISITSGSNGFAYVLGSGAYPAGGYASEETAIGATVKLEGIHEANMLKAPGQLLHPYLGGTATMAMTLYGDAVHLPANTWNVQGDVMLLNSALRPLKVLAYNPDLKGYTAQVGEPTEWMIDPIEPLSEEDSRRFVLRLWPLPDVAYAVSVRACAFPDHFTISDLYAQRSLPFLGLEASLFLNTAVGDFSSTSFRHEAVDRAALEDRGAKADERLTQITNAALLDGPGFVGTPPGY